jgi:exodeoxyribonuclease VII small subunit
MADKTDVKTLTFEKALAELEQIVQKLEGGAVPLEESVAIYERGEALKRRCVKPRRAWRKSRSMPGSPRGPSRWM